MMHSTIYHLQSHQKGLMNCKAVKLTVVGTGFLKFSFSPKAWILSLVTNMVSCFLEATRSLYSLWRKCLSDTYILITTVGSLVLPSEKCVFWITISNHNIFPRQPPGLHPHFPPQILKRCAQGSDLIKGVTSAYSPSIFLMKLAVDYREYMLTPQWRPGHPRCKRPHSEKGKPHLTMKTALTSGTSPDKGPRGSPGTQGPLREPLTWLVAYMKRWILFWNSRKHFPNFP